MSDLPCPHCGQPHSPEAAVCPTTGKPLRPAGMPEAASPAASPAATAAPPPAASGGATAGATPEKGVADILKEAYQLYRTHARALLMTCAVLFAPAAVVNSCAQAVIIGPTVVAAGHLSEGAAESARAVQVSARALQDAYSRNADRATIDRLQAENARNAEELTRRGLAVAGDAMGNFTIFMLGLLGALVTGFFLYGVIVPLTNGALTIAVADRVLGGSAEWRQVWMLLFHRLGLLLSAVIPAALLIAVGCAFFIIPGLILGLFFAFVSPVVLIEGLRGKAALRRSIELVRSDWLRVALVIMVFAVLRWVAGMVAHVLIPRSAVFVGSLFGDLFTMVMLPFPVIGLVLLYFDIRRRRENFTQDRLRADLESLRSA